MLNTDRYRVPSKAGSRFKLARHHPDDHGKVTEERAVPRFAKLIGELEELQEKLYAGHTRSLLVVFQAMDCGGKDSTIRHVLGPINPQGCTVTSFKAPTAEELDHDFLWRIHAHTPAKGMIAVFNRSHYEDVLIARVKNLVPRKVWKDRYNQINEFEALLHEQGTRVVKFYLHISKGYQKDRLLNRLEDPKKHWKFNPDDLAERKRWGQYQKAYEEALRRCSTEHAPWYIVPAEHRWFRNLLVAQVLVETLKDMDLHYPKATFNPRKIVVE